jgi:glycosyltransferase involved in cell wall biosynthesis
MAGSGAGPEFSNCIELAKKLGRRVTNHGYVTHRRLSELMKMAHVQVLPSFFEGLPLVLFEGLASGCRIITTNLSGFKEIFGRAKKCFSKLANAETCDYKGSTPYELGNGQSVEDLIVRAGIAREDVKIVFVNSRKVDFDTVLADGDNVGLAPSVGGM